MPRALVRGCTIKTTERSTRTGHDAECGRMPIVSDFLSHMRHCIAVLPCRCQSGMEIDGTSSGACENAVRVALRNMCKQTDTMLDTAAPRCLLPRIRLRPTLPPLRTVVGGADGHQHVKIPTPFARADARRARHGSPRASFSYGPAPPFSIAPAYCCRGDCRSAQLRQPCGAPLLSSCGRSRSVGVVSACARVDMAWHALFLGHH